MINIRRSFILLLLIVSPNVFTGPALAQEECEGDVILGLYDSSEEFNRGEDSNLIHNNAEMVLNHLGMKVRYYDVMKGPPPKEVTENVRGILTWFQDDKMARSSNYCDWLVGQIDAGKKVAILNNLGAFEDKDSMTKIDDEQANQVFNRLGLEYRGNWTDNPFVIELVRKDPGMVEFERTLDDELGLYEQIVPLGRENRSYLELRRKDMAGSESQMVVVTPQGGYVSEDYDVSIDYVTGRAEWRIDPFRFFEEAFALKNRPRFDTTTLFGRRIFYSHIDGDGIRNVCEMDNQRLAGEVIRDEILKVYDLPVTASFITAEIDPDCLGSQKMAELARSILEIEHAEAGVHGFTHPLDWHRKITAMVVKGYSKPLLEEPDILSESAYGKGAYVTVDYENFLDREIREAVNYVNENLLSGGKQVKIYQWTGNCRPPADAIEKVNALGIKNINGGDSRFDRACPSYSRVAPLKREVGGAIQFFTSNANENIYTEGWNMPFDRFAQVIETFQQTERPTLVHSGPRRVSPMNVYYHFFIGEKAAGLESLRRVYDYALTQEIIPIYASEYVSVVEGFLRSVAEARRDGGWEFSNYGDCRTVRFDNVSIFPDFTRSEGILGFRTWGNSIYIHLADTNRAVLYLTNEPPRQPFLREASTLVFNWKISGENITFEARGFEEGEYWLANLDPESTFNVQVTKLKGERPEIARKSFRSDREGNLEFRVPAKGWVRIEVVKTQRG